MDRMVVLLLALFLSLAVYQIFSRGGTLAYVLLPLIIILLRIHMLRQPELFFPLGDDLSAAPLWDYTFGLIPAKSLAAAIVASLVTLVNALAIGHVVARYSLLPQTSALPSFFYVVFSSAFRQGVCLSPAQVFAFFFILCFDRLFSAMRKDKPYRSVFWAALWFAVGCFFWAKAVWFLPMWLVVMLMVRVGSMRTLASALVGSVAVFVISLACWLVVSQSPLDSFVGFHQAMVSRMVSVRYGAVLLVYIGILSALFVVALFSLQARLYQLNIDVSRRVRAVRFAFFYVVALYFLPIFATEMQVPLAICASMLVPLFVESLATDFQRNVVMLGLFAYTFWFAF